MALHPMGASMITCRPIERTDLPMLKRWRNSTDVMPYVREYRFLTDHDQERWYSSYLASRRTSDFDQELLILEWEGEAFGVGGFTRIEWKNRKAELSFYSINRDYIKEALTALIDKAFNEFGFHKIYWPVYSHDPNLETYSDIFHEEAVLCDEYYYNGWQDRIYLSLLNPNDDSNDE